MEYLLDTDICIFFLKGKFRLRQKIERIGVENCYVSEITVLELIYGAKSSAKYKEHLRDVAKIRDLFEVIPIEEAFERFAEEKLRLKKAGLLIPDFDLLIGTTASAKGAILVTNNQKHLQRIENITIENWTNPNFNELINEK